MGAVSPPGDPNGVNGFGGGGAGGRFGPADAGTGGSGVVMVAYATIPVPEPSTIVLALGGAAGVTVLARRRKPAR